MFLAIAAGTCCRESRKSRVGLVVARVVPSSLWKNKTGPSGLAAFGESRGKRPQVSFLLLVVNPGTRCDTSHKSRGPGVAPEPRDLRQQVPKSFCDKSHEPGRETRPGTTQGKARDAGLADLLRQVPRSTLKNKTGTCGLVIFPKSKLADRNCFHSYRYLGNSRIFIQVCKTII